MPNPIETDENLAKALGLLAGRWGQAEFVIEMIYTTLSEMPHRKATITFSFFKAVATQKDIVFFMVDETTWLTKEEKNTIRDAVKRFASMSEQRNGFIHFPFGFDTQSVTKNIYKGKRLKKGDSLYIKLPVDADTILTFADKVSEMYEGLLEANGVVREAWLRTLTAPLLRPSLLQPPERLLAPKRSE